MTHDEFSVHNRWFGNYVVSVIGIATLFCCVARRNRPYWLTGATIATTVFMLLFALAVTIELGSKTSGWFTLQFLLTYMSALPIQTVFNWILGEDNFVEEHLMIPTALLMWSVVGAAIGAATAKLKRRRGAE